MIPKRPAEIGARSRRDSVRASLTRGPMFEVLVQTAVYGAPSTSSDTTPPSLIMGLAGVT